MRRRQLLLASPVLAAAACTALEEDPGTTGPSEGGGAPAGTADPSDAGGTGTPERTDAPTEPTRTEDPAEAAIQERLDALDPRGIAGQLVLVGIPAGTEFPRSTRTDDQVGGYFLLGVWESAEEVEAMVAAAQDGPEDAVPPLLAVDQEGGQVRMLRGDAASEVDSAATLGEEGTEAVSAAYRTIGEDLAARGLHLDLAPVADVVDPQLGDANEPVGGLDRGFGTDPTAVADCVTAAVETLDEAGIGATLKHFPGLGRVEQNTDFSAEGIVDETTGPRDPFLEPFRAGIAAGTDAVMLSSAIYPRLEDGVPAMFSAACVQDLLRDQLGFDGLVVTDDIGAAEAVADVPVADRATRLLAAGGDAVLTADPGLAGQLVDAIEDWAAQSSEQEQRVRESAARMLRVKTARGVLTS